MFLNSEICDDQSSTNTNAQSAQTVLLPPYKKARDMWRHQRKLKHLRKKMGIGLEPVYTNPKIGDQLKLREVTPALVNNQ